MPTSKAKTAKKTAAKPPKAATTPSAAAGRTATAAPGGAASVARLITQVADVQLRVAQLYESLLALQQGGSGFQSGVAADRNDPHPQKVPVVPNPVVPGS